MKEQDSTLFRAIGGLLRAGSRTAHDPQEEPIGQIRLNVAAVRATGTEFWQPYCPALLADACAQRGRVAAGPGALARALAAARATGERRVEAELPGLRDRLGKRRQALDPLASVHSCPPRASSLPGHVAGRGEQGSMLEPIDPPEEGGP